MTSDLWLVRSGGRILGPYSLDDLIESIKLREITIHDEVATSLGYWQIITKSPSLEGVVDELMSQGFDDEVTNTGYSEFTQTLSVTERISDDFEDGQTATVDITNLDPPTQIIDIADDPEPTSAAQGPSQTPNQQTPVRSYSFEPTQEMTKKSSQWARQLWSAVVIVSLVIIGSVYYARHMQSPKSSGPVAITKLPVGDMIRLAQVKLKTGQYEEALLQFKHAHKLKPSNESLYIYIGSLLVRLGDNDTEAKDFLMKASNLDSVEVKKRAYVSYALLAMKNENYEEAEKQLNKALLLDQNYYPALINLAQISALNGNINQAQNLFQSARTTGKEPELTSFLYAFFELERKRKGEEVDSELIKNMLDSISSKKSILLQESMLLNLYLNVDSLDNAGLEAQILKLLNVDPGFQSEFRWNLFVNNSNVSWSMLLPYCEGVAEKMEDSGLRSSLLSICYAKAGDTFKANTLVSKATTQTPEHPLVLANSAFVKAKASLFREEGVFLKQAVEKNTAGVYELPSVLRAKYCLIEGDKDCAISEAQKVLRENPNNLSALSVMATIHQYKGDTQIAKNYASQGLQQSKEYIPIIKIAEALDKGQ